MLVGLVALFRKGRQMELEPRNRWIGVDLSFDKKQAHIAQSARKTAEVPARRHRGVRRAVIRVT